MNTTYPVLMLFWLGFQSAFCLAKDESTLKGKLVDELEKPIYLGTLQLLKNTDSSFVKGEISDENGNFSFVGMASGKYVLKVTCVNYEPYFSAPIELNQGEILDLGKITIKEKTTKLGEVEIVARKPLFQRVEDKMIFNVGELASAVGSNGFEMLRKAPGVVIDKDSRIMLKGKSGVRIQINGKPSPLSVSDLAAYLQSIPATDIEAIEIIENPSARYEASGKAGIINIKLKKDKNLGTNGSSNASLGMGKKYPKLEAGSRFNHRTKKMNVYAGYTNNTFKNWNFNNFYRIQNGLEYDQHSENHDETQGQFYRAGIDLTPNKKHTFGFMYFGGYKESVTNNFSSTRILQQNTGKWFENLLARNRTQAFRQIHNNNFNYEYKIAEGTQLNVDLNYDIYNNNTRSFQPNQYTDVEGSVLRNVDFGNASPNTIQVRTGSVDFEKRIFGGKLSTGAKVSNIKTDNDFQFFNVEDGVNKIDSFRTNRFIYTENVNALYLSFARNISKKINFQAGLRMEETRSEGDLKALDANQNKINKRHYLDLFPSFNLNIEQSAKVSWGLNYSRRIDRPSYQDLNPFENKIDELTYQKGNPFLRPQYTHSISLSNTLFQAVNQSISYSFTSDYSGQITDTIESSRVFLTPKNIASEQVYGYNVSTPIPISKKLSGFLNMGVNHSQYHADFGNGKVIDLSAQTFNFYMQQSYSFSKNTSFEMSGFYNSPSVWGGTFRNKSMYSVDAGLKMKFMEQKLSVNLTLSDIFYTQKWRGTNNFGGLRMRATGGWESRQLRLGLLYRFGNQYVKGARNRTVGSDAESKRAKAK